MGALKNVIEIVEVPMTEVPMSMTESASVSMTESASVSMTESASVSMTEVPMSMTEIPMSMIESASMAMTESTPMPKSVFNQLVQKRLKILYFV